VTPHTPQPESRPFKWRYVFYAMALALVFFLILDGIIIWLEKGGHIDIQRKDDRVWLSTGNPWVAQGDL
jgi:hypothetical protein